MQDDRRMIQSDGTVTGEATGMILDNTTVMQGERTTALEGQPAPWVTAMMPAET